MSTTLCALLAATVLLSPPAPRVVPDGADAPVAEITPAEQLRQWKRHRGFVLAALVVSGAVLGAGVTLGALWGVNRRDLGPEDQNPGLLVGGSVLAATGVAGVVAASVAAARHRKRDPRRMAFRAEPFVLRF